MSSIEGCSVCSPAGSHVPGKQNQQQTCLPAHDEVSVRTNQWQICCLVFEFPLRANQFNIDLQFSPAYSFVCSRTAQTEVTWCYRVWRSSKNIYYEIKHTHGQWLNQSMNGSAGLSECFFAPFKMDLKNNVNTLCPIILKIILYHLYSNYVC